MKPSEACRVVQASPHRQSPSLRPLVFAGASAAHQPRGGVSPHHRLFSQRPHRQRLSEPRTRTAATHHPATITGAPARMLASSSAARAFSTMPPAARPLFVVSPHGSSPAAVRPPSQRCVAARATWDNSELDKWQQQQQQQQPAPEVQQQQEAQRLDRLPADPHATLERVLEVVREGNLDGMLEFCPDEVIDRLLAWRKATGPPDADIHFADILHACSDPALLYLDTFAVRNLFMTAPASVNVLSAMQITPDKYLQRCAIVSPSGEECVLTFTVVLQDCLECQYRGPPLLSAKWMLRGVTGECNSDELPSHPSPSFPPEAVVEAQLAALRECRVGPVFAHASPQNKAATGPVERFAAMLTHNPLYAPLMGHAAAETVQRLQPSESTYMEVVRITPRQPAAAGAAAAGASSSGSSDGEPLLFMWIVSRQPGSSTWAHCWMTDAVQMVSVVPAAAQPPVDNSSTNSSSSSV